MWSGDAYGLDEHEQPFEMFGGPHAIDRRRRHRAVRHGTAGRRSGTARPPLRRGRLDVPGRRDLAAQHGRPGTGVGGGRADQRLGHGHRATRFRDRRRHAARPAVAAVAVDVTGGQGVAPHHLPTARPGRHRGRPGGLRRHRLRPGGAVRRSAPRGRPCAGRSTAARTSSAPGAGPTGSTLKNSTRSCCTATKSWTRSRSAAPPAWSRSSRDCRPGRRAATGPVLRGPRRRTVRRPAAGHHRPHREPALAALLTTWAAHECRRGGRARASGRRSAAGGSAARSSGRASRETRRTKAAAVTESAEIAFRERFEHCADSRPHLVTAPLGD